VLPRRPPFVADHQRHYGVKRLCNILGIARSSFSHWRRTAADWAVRRATDARLAARLRKVHQGLGRHLRYAPGQGTDSGSADVVFAVCQPLLTATLPAVGSSTARRWASPR
jgi:hypothetical protein